MNNDNNGIFYIVPTPIGNLEDITIRAVDILKNVHIVFSEDTRTSKILMNHYSINTPLESYHKFNEKSKINKIIRILESGKDLALISDAGTPCISDPGFIIVDELIKKNIEVITLPGATAFVPALVSSGLRTDCFLFLGFLPEKKKERKLILKKYKNFSETLVFYLSVHKYKIDLKDIYEYWGDRNVVLSREISKKFETHYRNKLSSFISEDVFVKEKGEFVLTVEGVELKMDDIDLEKEINERLRNKLTVKDIVEELTLISNFRKKEIYSKILMIKEKGD